MVFDFWTETFLPWAKDNLKPSSVHGYGKLWDGVLKVHFAGRTLQGYKTCHGSEFLSSLAPRMTRNSLSPLKLRLRTRGQPGTHRAKPVARGEAAGQAEGLDPHGALHDGGGQGEPEAARRRRQGPGRVRPELLPRPASGRAVGLEVGGLQRGHGDDQAFGLEGLGGHDEDENRAGGSAHPSGEGAVRKVRDRPLRRERGGRNHASGAARVALPEPFGSKAARHERLREPGLEADSQGEV